MPASQGMGIGDLAEQDPRWRNDLLKGQGAAHQKPGKAQLREHHAVEQADENDGEAANAALEQAEAQQTR